MEIRVLRPRTPASVRAIQAGGDVLQPRKAIETGDLRI